MGATINSNASHGLQHKWAQVSKQQARRASADSGHDMAAISQRHEAVQNCVNKPFSQFLGAGHGRAGEGCQGLQCTLQHLALRENSNSYHPDTHNQERRFQMEATLCCSISVIPCQQESAEARMEVLCAYYAGNETSRTFPAPSSALCRRPCSAVLSFTQVGTSRDCLFNTDRYPAVSGTRHNGVNSEVGISVSNGKDI